LLFRIDVSPAREDVIAVHLQRSGHGVGGNDDVVGLPSIRFRPIPAADPGAFLLDEDHFAAYDIYDDVDLLIGRDTAERHGVADRISARVFEHQDERLGEPTKGECSVDDVDASELVAVRVEYDDGKLIGGGRRRRAL
jgi:hypothetical protein